MTIEIREVILSDAQFLFNWANDPVTRQNSFNSEPIEWNDHILWLKKRLFDLKNKTYILHSNEEPIGVVKFEGIEDTIIGVTVAPFHRGKGLGVEIIKIGCNKYWENNDLPILAYIKKDNVASQHVFKKAGFTFLKDEIIYGKACLILKAKKNAY